MEQRLTQSFKKMLKTYAKMQVKKVRVFSHVAGHQQNQKGIILHRTLMMQAFDYCPLILIFYSKTANNKIHRLHKHALRVLHADYASMYI